MKRFENAFNHFTEVKVTVIQNDVDLEPRDKNDKTPLNLAVGHRHMDIVDVLQAAIKRRSGWFPPVGEVWGLLFGRAGNSKIPLIFFMSSVLLWSYPMYVIRVSISCICFVCMYMTANCNFYNFSR